MLYYCIRQSLEVEAGLGIYRASLRMKGDNVSVNNVATICCSQPWLLQLSATQEQNLCVNG